MVVYRRLGCLNEVYSSLDVKRISVQWLQSIKEDQGFLSKGPKECVSLFTMELKRIMTAVNTAVIHERRSTYVFHVLNRRHECNLF